MKDTVFNRNMISIRSDIVIFIIILIIILFFFIYSYLPLFFTFSTRLTQRFTDPPRVEMNGFASRLEETRKVAHFIFLSFFPPLRSVHIVTDLDLC